MSGPTKNVIRDVGHTIIPNIHGGNESSLARTVCLPRHAHSWHTRMRHELAKWCRCNKASMDLRLLLHGLHTHFGERRVCMFVSMLNGKMGPRSKKHRAPRADA